MIVRTREYLRWAQSAPPHGEWVRRTLDAIREDRLTDDYLRDRDAR